MFKYESNYTPIFVLHISYIDFIVFVVLSFLITFLTILFFFRVSLDA